MLNYWRKCARSHETNKIITANMKDDCSKNPLRFTTLKLQRNRIKYHDSHLETAGFHSYTDVHTSSYLFCCDISPRIYQKTRVYFKLPVLPWKRKKARYGSEHLFRNLWTHIWALNFTKNCRNNVFINKLNFFKLKNRLISIPVSVYKFEIIDLKKYQYYFMLVSH